LWKYRELCEHLKPFDKLNYELLFKYRKMNAMLEKIRGREFSFQDFDALVAKFGSRKVKNYKKNVELSFDRKVKMDRYEFISGLLQTFQACSLRLCKKLYFLND